MAREKGIERKWRIYLCPNRGKRHAGAYFCRCVVPSSRARSIEVMPVADHLEALGEVEKRAEKAEKTAEHTRYWYAVRLERIRDLAKEKGIWDEVACIIANGTVSSYEPPTYAQQLNVSKYRAEAAETELQGLREALGELAKWNASMVPGYEAAAQSPEGEAYHQGVAATLKRVGEKVQALLDTGSADEGSGA